MVYIPGAVALLADTRFLPPRVGINRAAVVERREAEAELAGCSRAEVDKLALAPEIAFFLRSQKIK